MVCLVGYGPTAPELKVLCSTDWATGTLLYTLMIYSYKKLVLTVGFEQTRNYPLDPKTSVAAITPREHIYKSLWLASRTFLRILLICFEVYKMVPVTGLEPVRHKVMKF